MKFRDRLDFLIIPKKKKITSRRTSLVSYSNYNRSIGRWEQIPWIEDDLSKDWWDLYFGWCGERETGEGVTEWEKLRSEKIEAGERVREAESMAARQGNESGWEAVDLEGWSLSEELGCHSDLEAVTMSQRKREKRQNRGNGGWRSWVAGGGKSKWRDGRQKIEMGKWEREM